MPSSWLVRMRKAELAELAQKANLPDVDGMLKDDLVEALQDHLEANETTFAKQSTFSEFYRRTGNGSPVKRERASPSDGIAVTKTRRRQTRLLENVDSEEPTPEKALVTRTPRTVSRVASRVTQVDLPASPAQLAEVADQQFKAAKTKAGELWKKTGTEEIIELVRENASSVTAVQLAVLLIESVGLQWNTVATVHAFDTPTVPQLSLNSQNVYLPDLRVLLTSEFWAPATLWSLTSIFLPLLVSYFFNLTLRTNTRHKSSSRAYTVDPLTFNIVKAISQYIVYQTSCVPIAPAGVVPAAPILACAENVPFAFWSGETVNHVRTKIPGQYYGLQIGAIVGVLISLYDAALKK
ncbi:uncharacterized protein BDR25DRAFT_333098 [Lindgomyces ingoldianus]|uniref:Uncharacterized protein n=1 Tax=Lindgomyces ingoldianus TaxID=673940 RepID=A0ACB6R2W0_9PLEO|nr:uncharacterized protein BDR25DRAFT_333098 [Lindgomyces ingoldianus]KAF2472776.1 hypothetical protein BDR25DRAFT_333098 [Lindgomyces ingoldianus]